MALSYRKKLYLLLIFLPCLSACSSLLYYPSKSLLVDPKSLSLKPEDVWFQSEDGIKLSGWYFQGSKKPKALLVFYHGNGENMSSHFLSLAWILNHGYDFFIFDYRGYGRSEGNATPEGTHKDGLAALAWAQKKAGKLPIVIFAQSLGGAVALRNLIALEGKIPIALTVIDSSFLSYQETAQKIMAKSPVTWLFQWLPHILLSDRFAPGEEIKKIKTPLLVIHGDQDQVIPYSLGQELFQKAETEKSFWTIPGGRHTDVFTLQAPKYFQPFLSLLEKYTR